MEKKEITLGIETTEAAGNVPIELTKHKLKSLSLKNQNRFSQFQRSNLLINQAGPTGIKNKRQ